MDEGGGTLAEKIVRGGEFGPEIPRPKYVSCREFEAVEDGIDPEGVCACAIDGRTCAGGVFDTEIGDMNGLVFVAPILLACFGVETFDGFGICPRAEDMNQERVFDHGWCKAGTAGDFPHEGRAGLGESCDEGGFD